MRKVAMGLMDGLAVLTALMFAASTSDARSRHRHTEAESGQFDYYLLTLSWSPTYCLTHPDDRPQCSNKGYGFVLHGLWPQFDSGGYPEQCATDAQLTDDAEAVGRTVYPSVRLMHHEWQTHGTCSGLDAAGYFRAADQALGALKIPRAFDAPATTASLRGSDVAAQFIDANPAIPPDGIVVSCSRGELSEVRICLNRDLKPRSCGRGVRMGCGADAIQVPSSR